MNQASPALTLQCPVCAARFRGSVTCSRCGTDLSALMWIAARAWAARQRCRAALAAADLDGALHWAAAARRLHRPASRGEAARQWFGP